MKAPEAPPRVVDSETGKDPRREREPQLIAPPPAYGNKVVMARSGDASPVN